MKAKKFDCVAMMHRGAEEVRKKTRGMKKKEEVTFWRDRSQKLKQRQTKAREERKPDRSNAGMNE
jgi:hypothetical protein